MRENLRHLGGLLAAGVVAVLFSFGYLGMFLVGLTMVLWLPLLLAVVAWYTARAAVLDVWAAVRRR